MDSQDLGCRGPVAPAFLERWSQDRRLGELEELFVERSIRPGVLPKRPSGPSRELGPISPGFEAGGWSRLGESGGEVLGPDWLAAGDDGCVLDGVAQLPYVSGPGPARARRGRRRRARVSVTVARRACLRKCSARAGMSSRRSRRGGMWIWKTLSRKNKSSRNSPAVIKVAQRPVGGRDHANVGGPRPCIADRRDLTVFDGSEQLDLETWCDVTDLVQKHRAAARQLEQPFAVLDRPGERALQVPEELALDQAGVEGGQADRQERPVAPAAVAVDRPGHQLLAGAALAGDQHRYTGRRDQAMLLKSSCIAGDEPISASGSCGGGPARRFPVLSLFLGLA